MNELKPLENKVILITGASSGIGKAVAIECAKSGATVIITGRNEDRLGITAKEIAEVSNLSPTSMPGDLADADFRKTIAEQLKGQQLHGLALCAGTVSVVPVAFATNEKVTEIFNVNFFANVDLIRLFLKTKSLKKGSSIAIVTSVLGIDGYMTGNASYGASKAALESWVRYCALEYAGKGIRFNSVHPGSIDTPMLDVSSITKEQLDEAIRKIPMRRIGLPSEIAQPMVFLLSDQSSFMTGSSIMVDGGQHLLF